MDASFLEGTPSHGEQWTALVEILLFDETQKSHRIKTALKGELMIYEGTLPVDTTIILLVNAISNKVDDHWAISSDCSTSVIPRPTMQVKGLQKVVELCAGMGCLGVGMTHAGFEISLRCDWNPSMIRLAKKISDAPTLIGNLCDDQVLAKTCQAAPDAGVLTSGIACQPYSRLGDGRAQADVRSATLPGTLRFGFLGRFAIMLLECVAEAGECSWVQTTLAKFTALTGYLMTQGELKLQSVWPARRHRWWCILAHPAIGQIPWSPFPQVQPLPLVAHLIDSFKTCNDFELKNLTLDLYELGRFAAAGFDTNEIPWTGQMATALHSCGNQLGSCPCGCRSHPFTENRLAKGGLHGLLVRLAGHAKCGVSLYPSYRHVHPDELALLNGMFPGFEWDEPKLALCALGQLASPLQSTWMGAHIMNHVHQVFNMPSSPSPEQVLLRLMKKLLEKRDAVFGEPSKPSTKLFQHMVDSQQFVMSAPCNMHAPNVKVPGSSCPIGVPPTMHLLTPQETSLNNAAPADLSDGAGALNSANTKVPAESSVPVHESCATDPNQGSKQSVIAESVDIRASDPTACAEGVSTDFLAASEPEPICCPVDAQATAAEDTHDGPDIAPTPYPTTIGPKDVTSQHVQPGTKIAVVTGFLSHAHGHEGFSATDHMNDSHVLAGPGSFPFADLSAPGMMATPGHSNAIFTSPPENSHAPQSPERVAAATNPALEFGPKSGTLVPSASKAHMDMTACMLPQNKRKATEPCDSTGGVTGFETSKRFRSTRPEFNLQQSASHAPGVDTMPNASIKVAGEHLAPATTHEPQVTSHADQLHSNNAQAPSVAPVFGKMFELEPSATDTSVCTHLQNASGMLATPEDRNASLCESGAIVSAGQVGNLLKVATTPGMMATPGHNK